MPYRSRPRYTQVFSCNAEVAVVSVPLITVLNRTYVAQSDLIRHRVSVRQSTIGRIAVVGISPDWVIATRIKAGGITSSCCIRTHTEGDYPRRIAFWFLELL